MAPDTVPAIWLGPYKGERGPGVPDLEIGDECQVSPELLESGHWGPVAAAAAAGAAAAAPTIRPVTGANASANEEGS